MQDIKVAVDAVVFGYTQNKLHLVLIKQKFGSQKDKWALPGGFVKNKEDLETALQRELQEETGITANYQEQLYTFGAVDRDPRARVISTAYLVLVNPKNYQLKADTDAKDVKWFSIEDIPDLAFDHNAIITKALDRLKAKINYQPIGFELLNPLFPFSDLENLYQTILGKAIDRRNFRKKILSFGFITQTDKIHKASSGRPAKLFCFNTQKYKALEKEGIVFEIKFA